MSKDDKKNGDWDENRKWVGAELNRLNGNYENLRTSFERHARKIEVEIAKLKIKSSLWGASASGVVLLIAWLVREMTAK